MTLLVPETVTDLTRLPMPSLDAEHLMLDEVDTSEKPLFTVSEMASFFFARSSHWVRWLESCHFVVSKPGEKKRECNIHPTAHTARMAAEHEHTWRLMFNGKFLEPLRTSSNARVYDLALVEKIAHALAFSGTIQGFQLRQALTLVRIEAQMNNYLPSDDDPLISFGTPLDDDGAPAADDDA